MNGALTDHQSRASSDPTNVLIEAAGHPFHLGFYDTPADPLSLLVWVHGGAFMFGGVDMPEADQTARLLAAAGVAVVSVDYSLAPVIPNPFTGPDGNGPPDEGPATTAPRVRFPIASLQVMAAFDWAAELAAIRMGEKASVCIGGASAGGNLAAGATLRLRDRGELSPETVVLAYPLLHATLPTPSAELADRLVNVPAALAFPEEVTSSFNWNYVGSDELLVNPYAFPGGHDLRLFPPTLIINAESDRLRASGELFAAELAVAGAEVHVCTEPGTLHGYLNDVGSVSAQRTIQRIVRWVTRS